MWTRAELKQNAKGVLRNYYWQAILASLIFFGIVIFISIPFSIASTVMQMQTVINGGIPSSTPAASNSFFEIIRLVITFFVICPLTVGLYKFFINLRNNRLNYGDIFASFRKGHYLSVVGASAWMSLWTFLWTLLLIVPGIIKGISYSMTPFILADNPKIGYRRALKLSMAMTDGQKGAIFVLGLSFIGWALLGALCCLIGDFFLTPYIYSTFTELYIKLRSNALEKGLCTPSELNLA